MTLYEILFFPIKILLKYFIKINVFFLGFICVYKISFLAQFCTMPLFKLKSGRIEFL